jgi:hypothetical protein
MGLFDKAEQRNLAEVFPPGVPFRLANAWIEGQAKSGTGAIRTLAKVVVSAVQAPDAESEYGVWGSLAEQVRHIEPGELPAIVTLDVSTGLWRFAPHGPAPQVSEDPETGAPVERPMSAVPEAHLDLERGESDSPTPVPPAAQPVGTEIDDSHSEPAPALPAEVAPRGTDIDEAQTFQPGGQPPLEDQGNGAV